MMHSASRNSLVALPAAALFFCFCAAAAAAPRKTVFDYSDGLIFETDGGIPNGPCIRITGRLIAPDFFDQLKRVEDRSGTRFIRGRSPITGFPRQMQLQLSIQDMLCPPELRSDGPVYLTGEDIKTLQIFFFWKRGFALRPAAGITKQDAVAAPLLPFAQSLADTIPKRYVWMYEFTVPSGGVPLTDHLVLVLRQPGGHIVVRVAARL